MFNRGKICLSESYCIPILRYEVEKLVWNSRFTAAEMRFLGKIRKGGIMTKK
jgi:hypothetical protein